MSMVRTATPTYLTDFHSEKYKGQYYPNYKYLAFIFADKKDASKFNWHGLRDNISTDLQKITQNHCSFCDCYPLGTGKIKDTIEHFRPKHRHPLLAYYWGNLFLSCHYCQEVPKKWNEKDIKWVLKPDAANYNFLKYFQFDAETGEIKVNEYNTNLEEQKRAQKTIEYYKLNTYKRLEVRLEMFNLYNQSDFELDKREFRFMFT